MEFWERNFIEKQEMWGDVPTHSAEITKDLFLANDSQEILIPGFGYGRNAHQFLASGMQVTGIELSKTAIELARKHFGDETMIYHGSVVDMSFDTKKYDGIFCYGLLYLLGSEERAKFIDDCYAQLSEKGLMIFTVVSKRSTIYGQGTKIGQDRLDMFGGVNMFFYDMDSILAEFSNYGLMEVREVEENFPFYMIICKK